MATGSAPAFNHKPVVCVQGLGFVGAAMAVAVANARDPDGGVAFEVIGVDLDHAEARRRIDSLNNGDFPFATSDAKLVEAARHAAATGALIATTDQDVYRRADIVIIDIPLDIDTQQSTCDFTGLRGAVRTLGDHLRPGALVILETTVPPGTCEHVVAPELAAGLARRGLPASSILLAHSYERVMPGPDYFDSIINYWRVFAGHTPEAAAACRGFLERIINVEQYPLTELASTTASELAKVLENTFRAVTIALMDEWGKFAEAAGVNLFDVVGAIRTRPTHANMRTPGFGVGGYCLTKDPLFGPVAATQIFSAEHAEFPLSRAAVDINAKMPLHVLDRMQKALGGSVRNKRILLLGVAYRSQVGDTRHSPSEIFYRATRQAGAAVQCHDPFVQHWEEIGVAPLQALPDLRAYDAVVIAVAHQAYAEVDFGAELQGGETLVVDGNGVLSAGQRESLRKSGVPVVSVGWGET